MLDVEVVQWLVEQDVWGVLREHHCDERALSLAAGQLVEVAVAQVDQIGETDRLLDVAVVLGAQASLAVRETSEADQIGDGQPRGEVVFLPQDRHDLADLDVGAVLHVEPADQGAPVGGLQQTPGHRQQRRFARSVRTDERRQATVRDRQGRDVEHGGLVVADGEVVELDHRRTLLMSR